MSSTHQISVFEKLFSTQETFRRNKHYVDILKINSQEHLDQQKRRMPFTKRLRASVKMEQNFINAKKQIEHKLGQDIDKFKFRLSFYGSTQANPEIQSSRYTDEKHTRQISPRDIKGVPIDKVQSRQRLQQLKNKPTVDQRQFNNFYLTKHDLSHIPKMESYSPRNSNIALLHMTDLYYDSNPKYQEIYFDNRTNSCIFNLKKQNDQKSRYFFPHRRQQHDPSTDLKPESVAKSFSVANPYKTNKMLQFYKAHGREMPSQYDQRFLSPNKNYYKDKNQKFIKEQMSFTANKYRDQLIQRDLNDIKKSKKPYFNRDEICDQRYFQQQKKTYKQQSINK